MKEGKARLHVLLYGRVQGVGLRWYAVRRAVELGLTGWVRNLYDGSVELVAEGDRMSLETMLDYLRSGPGRSHVEAASIEWSGYSGEFPDFRAAF